MELVKRTLNIEDHLGLGTGPLESEKISLSGRHNDVNDLTSQFPPKASISVTGA